MTARCHSLSFVVTHCHSLSFVDNFAGLALKVLTHKIIIKTIMKRSKLRNKFLKFRNLSGKQDMQQAKKTLRLAVKIGLRQLLLQSWHQRLYLSKKLKSCKDIVLPDKNKFNTDDDEVVKSLLTGLAYFFPQIISTYLFCLFEVIAFILKHNLRSETILVIKAL